MDTWIVNDEPEDRCYGCGHSNPQGLRLRFRRLASGEVETFYTAPEFLAGAPGVVHGGIQAAILDEVMGHAVHFAANEELDVVTVDFQLRYRRPVATGQEIRAVARHLRTEDRDFYVEGDIRNAEGEVLTRASARWRRIDRR